MVWAWTHNFPASKDAFTTPTDYPNIGYDNIIASWFADVFQAIGDIMDALGYDITGGHADLKTWLDTLDGASHTQGTDQKLDEGGASEVSVADVKDAVDEKHVQDTDQKLDEGGPNELTVANISAAVAKAHIAGTEVQIGDVSGTVANSSVDKIKGTPVDNTDKGADKILQYNNVSGNLEYEDPPVLGDVFVDRGDPAAPDKQAVDLTKDGAWHDWDLSAIVPANAKAVVFRVAMQDDAVASRIGFRQNGNANTVNVQWTDVHVANLTVNGNFIVACDGSRIVEYFVTNVVWTFIQITVVGWFF